MRRPRLIAPPPFGSHLYDKAVGFEGEGRPRKLLERGQRFF